MSKIVVALSGGVDSAVCAHLLKAAGHQIKAVFMRNWDSITNNDIRGNNSLDESQCTQESDYEDAKKVAHHLGIELYRFDFIEEYWNEVFSDFLAEYQRGRTPNPDIFCNKYIKFGHFSKLVLEKFDADFIATGHYAIIKNGLLYRGVDESKDQSYFLSQLSKAQLNKVLMPLGTWKKSAVRALAQSLKLPVAQKKDSTGICFIGERKFQEFLKNYLEEKRGLIVSAATQEILGHHDGIMYYTLGQRKGLNLGGLKEPHFVSGFDVDKAIIYVAPKSHRELLLSDGLFASSLNLIDPESNLETTKNLSAKFRYRQKDVKVAAQIKNDQKLKIVFASPQEAITPGQHVVFYDDRKCLGGAIIDTTFRI